MTKDEGRAESAAGPREDPGPAVRHEARPRGPCPCSQLSPGRRPALGLEAYCTGPQRLPGGERTAGVTGVMGEWRAGPACVFPTLENRLGTQQTDCRPVVLGAPRFAEIWAPTDGFIANGGVKLAL